MSLGIPKVRYYRFLGDKPIWIGLYERLYMLRALFICKEITESFANQFIDLLLHLDSETYFYDDITDADTISIYICSAGGGAEAAIDIYKTMRSIVPDVCTINMGLAASAASLILVGGTITKRVGYPCSKVMIHQPSTSLVIGNARFLQKQAADMLELRNEIADIYAENTGKPVDVIQGHLERDYFMSATEAQDYGIIDHIVKSEKENEIKE